MSRFTFEVNNQRTLVFEQDMHNGPVFVYTMNADGTEDNSGPYARKAIPAGQFVMLHNLYVHIILNNIQNDFINPYGLNKEEERTMRTTIGSPEEYAEAFRRKLADGETMDALNATNHLALELKTITMEHFKAAAEVLAAEILKR